MPAHAALPQCPVARLAREQDGLQRAYNILEDLEVGETCRFNNAIWNEMMVIDAKITAIEEAASWERANSKDGAIFNLLLVGRDLSTIQQFEMGDKDLEQLVSRAKRNIYSALSALGCDFSEALVDCYMPARLDAVAKVNRVVEAVH